ncbi:hypothetical protein J1N35_000466 [Gossypium stocksii]|uniref:Uncharacterized protein n=1 Tax=Gossypium stocksii TaxID=47602 RepID=A0A9D3WIT8_9ROSI|nr:hypothetical protein J1N35_000466 [Gossypium stocksii]
MQAGYFHIHFGVIRLALNCLGAEGKLVVARIALLDSRYLEYQHACIATIEATLNSDLVITLFSNFTMALADPNLFIALKVQIQIIVAPQVPYVIVATLNYQIVYKVQDHAFNLSRHGIGDSLITVNTSDQPHCIHVSRIDSKISSVEAKVDDNTKMVKDFISLLQKRLDIVAKEPAAPGQDFFSHLA